MDGYILDACALIAYYTNEKGADVVQDIIGKSYFEKNYVAISNINLLEIFYDVYKTQGEAEAKNFLQDIANSSIRIIETIEKQAFIEAGRLKANYRISLADSIFLAEVLTNENCIGITADHHEFDVVSEKENINLLFIR